MERGSIQKTCGKWYSHIIFIKCTAQTLRDGFLFFTLKLEAFFFYFSDYRHQQRMLCENVLVYVYANYAQQIVNRSNRYACFNIPCVGDLVFT